MSLEAIARYKPGENVTVRAKAAIVAGRFVQVVAYGTDRSYEGEHAVAGDDHPFGVSQRSSSDPTKEDVHSVDLLVECVRSNAVARIEAGEAVTAPADVAVGTAGKAVKAAAAVAATLVTGKVSDNNAILWTAKAAGKGGNSLSVEILNTGKEKALSVNVDGNKIIVTAATNGTGAGEITSTAALVIAAIEAHDTASQLVTVGNSSTSSGAGVVAAVATTKLSGGTESTGGAEAVGKALTSAKEAGELIEVSLY